MTATAGPSTAAPSDVGAASNAQSATRVTILIGRRMTDLVLPASTPIETYIDETVDVLADLLDDAPADVLAGFDFKSQGVWAFARPGSPPLKSTESLDDAGVVDGALLTLVSVSRTERYRPLVEDVIDAIAVLDESPEFDRPALNHFVGLAIPLVTLAITGIGLWTWSQSGHGWWWILALGLLGLVVLGGSFAAQNRYQNLDLAESLLVAALPLLAGAAALAVPLPRGVTGLGAPQLAGGAAVLLLVVLATRGGPRKRAELAAFLAVLAAAVTAAAVAYGYGWQSWVPAGAIAFGLIIVTNAAKLTVAVARIALPPIPAPGEVVANEELLDPVAATSNITDEESATWRAIIDSVPSSAARLTERSTLARQLLVGFLGAGVLVLTAGAIAVVIPGHFFIHSLIVAALVTVVCGFRSRLYAERWCGWALLAATVAIPTGVMIRLCLWNPSGAWLVLALYVAVAAVTLVLVGATDGVGRVSPVTKRMLELFDGAAIAAVIPLLLWIAGVYDVIRNIRF